MSILLSKTKLKYKRVIAFAQGVLDKILYKNIKHFSYYLEEIKVN